VHSTEAGAIAFNYVVSFLAPCLGGDASVGVKFGLQFVALALPANDSLEPHVRQPDFFDASMKAEVAGSAVVYMPGRHTRAVLTEVDELLASRPEDIGRKRLVRRARQTSYGVARAARKSAAELFSNERDVVPFAGEDRPEERRPVERQELEAEREATRRVDGCKLSMDAVEIAPIRDNL
jgi:hypothetical protein